MRASAEEGRADPERVQRHKEAVVFIAGVRGHGRGGVATGADRDVYDREREELEERHEHELDLYRFQDV